MWLFRVTADVCFLLPFFVLVCFCFSLCCFLCLRCEPFLGFVFVCLLRSSVTGIPLSVALLRVCVVVVVVCLEAQRDEQPATLVCSVHDDHTPRVGAPANTTQLLCILHQTGGTNAHKTKQNKEERGEEIEKGNQGKRHETRPTDTICRTHKAHTHKDAKHQYTHVVT